MEVRHSSILEVEHFLEVSAGSLQIRRFVFVIFLILVNVPMS